MEVKKVLFVATAMFLLISCANETSKTKASVFEKVQTNACQTEMLENKYVVLWEDGNFTYEESENEEKFRDGFVQDNLKNIKKVYYDRRIKFLQENEISINSTPNSNLNNEDQLWGQKMIQADSAWSQNYYGQNVIVGVVDSYVDTTHSLLKNQIYTNTAEIPDNGIDDDKNSYIDDVNGMNFTGITDYTIKNEHGTHVSGIIAATHTDQMKGIAPKATIIPAPFITNDGSGSLGDAIKAMNYVVSQGATVINASWGGSVCVTSLQDAFQAISDKGVLIIVAAGNEHLDLDINPSYPAAFQIENQITVAASNENDYMASFSNTSFNFVHLAAPGNYIYSTTPSEKFNYLQGTSMAAPFVTGAAAIIWGAFPKATPKQIKEAIIQSVDTTPNHEFRVISRGRLNLAKAINYMSRF